MCNKNYQLHYILLFSSFLGVQHRSKPRNTYIRVEEKILEEFITSQFQQCFIKCRNEPLCIGQSIINLPHNLFNCKLITLEKSVAGSVSVISAISIISAVMLLMLLTSLML